MFTETQARIFKGLHEIGEEIANFYSDAVEMMHETSTLKSKANLIAHMAREIDGGLRDVFAPKELKELKEKELGKKAGHFASILVALGRDPSDSLAVKWHSIAEQFAGLAHRNRPYSPSKDDATMRSIWKEYEVVLDKLVGSFYGMSDRLKQFTEMEYPTEHVLPALKNLLVNPTNRNYFFSILNKPGWLEPLYKEGYFNIKYAPSKPVEFYGAGRWVELTCLSNIAGEKESRTDSLLLHMLERIMQAYLQDEIALDSFMISLIANMILDIQMASFKQLYSDFFRKFIRTQGHSDFFSSILTEKLP
ncbi:MAG TPA: hypothetical protein VGZ71_16955, partial [Puia sp.]|nr:hypothetical protein [Puia sp.]